MWKMPSASKKVFGGFLLEIWECDKYKDTIIKNVKSFPHPLYEYFIPPYPLQKKTLNPWREKQKY